MGQDAAKRVVAVWLVEFFEPLLAVLDFCVAGVGISLSERAVEALCSLAGSRSPYREARLGTTGWVTGLAVAPAKVFVFRGPKKGAGATTEGRSEPVRGRRPVTTTARKEDGPSSGRRGGQALPFSAAAKVIKGPSVGGGPVVTTDPTEAAAACSHPVARDTCQNRATPRAAAMPALKGLSCGASQMASRHEPDDSRVALTKPTNCSVTAPV